MIELEGECIKTKELEDALFQLVSIKEIPKALKEQVACEDFSENVLGFEEVDEAEDDEDGEEYGDQDDGNLQGGGSYYPNDVIPEEDI